MARLFDGTDDEIRCAIGDANTTLNGAWSIAVCFRPDTTGTGGIVNTNGGNDWAIWHDSRDIYVFGDGGGAGRLFDGALSQIGPWHILIVSKAAGTATPRAHVKNMTTGVWGHVDANGVLNNDTTSQTNWIIGKDDFGDAFFNGAIAAIAMYGEAFSDQAAETLADWDAWLEASPVIAWDFRTVPLVDVGSSESANQTSITGTTETDPPEGFFEPGPDPEPEPEPEEGIQNRGYETDADGWTTTDAGTTATRDTEDPGFGDGCLLIETDGAEAFQGIIQGPDVSYVTTSGATDWTLSIYAKGTGTVALRASSYQGDTSLANHQSEAQLLDDRWWYRLEFTFTTHADADAIKDFRLFTPTAQAIEIRIDGWQLDQGTEAQTYDGPDAGAEPPGPPPPPTAEAHDDCTNPDASYVWRKVYEAEPGRVQHFESGGPDDKPFRRLNLVDGDDVDGERVEIGATDRLNDPGAFCIWNEGDHVKFSYWMRFAENFPLNQGVWQLFSQLRVCTPHNGVEPETEALWNCFAGWDTDMGVYSYIVDEEIWNVFGYATEDVQLDEWIFVEVEAYWTQNPDGWIKMTVTDSQGTHSSEPVVLPTLAKATAPALNIEIGDSLPAAPRLGIYRNSSISGDTYVDFADIKSELVEPEPPVVATGDASNVKHSTATLNGTVNPSGQATVYWFEYGETTEYGASVPVGEDGDAGDGFGAVSVSEALSELEPETTYHFRLVAKNDTGEVEGDDKEFTTTAAPLPGEGAGGLLMMGVG